MAKYTYDEPTNREDLTDVITNISPTDTPITTMTGKTTAKATYHELPAGEPAAAAANAHAEDGYCKMMKKAVVSGEIKKGKFYATSFKYVE